MKTIDKLNKRYLSQTMCMSDCPTVWVDEVYNMLEIIDKELGICYREYSNRDDLIRSISKAWELEIKHLETGLTYRYRKKQSFLARTISFPKRLITHLYSSISYSISEKITIEINKIKNKVLKKRVTIDQIKEKYNDLRIYYSVNGEYSKWIDHQIRLCEVKLAQKGVYYKLEDLYNSTISYYDKDISDSMITKFSYREAFRQLNINMEDKGVKIEN